MTLIKLLKQLEEIKRVHGNMKIVAEARFGLNSITFEDLGLVLGGGILRIDCQTVDRPATPFAHCPACKCNWELSDFTGELCKWCDPGSPTNQTNKPINQDD